uniref:Uncharacterized protein n=1 Tax=viral metagenome TaxID=1070528 RepID=A0A6M3Y6M5_9ZZZZ
MDTVTLPKKVFDEILVTMAHAQIFIKTRQKMHPDGIALYEELFISLDKYASRQVSGVGQTEGMQNCGICGQLIIGDTCNCSYMPHVDGAESRSWTVIQINGLVIESAFVC